MIIPLNNNHISTLIKKLKKLKKKLSFHYVAYTILFAIVAFSVLQIVQATTPNPGHPWSELGDGVFSVTNNQSSLRTYTFPDANATILTTNNLITVAQGGTGVNTLTGIVKGNGAGAFSVASAGTDFQSPLVSGTNIKTINGGSVLGSGDLTVSGMVYPGSGIPNSTGSAWGTSYTTTGSGTVLALATSPSFVTPTLGVATATSININTNGTNMLISSYKGANSDGFNSFIGGGGQSSYGMGGPDTYLGSYNSAQGMNALYSNTTGSNNSAQGMNALYANTTGFNNSAQGMYALYYNTTGYNNSAQGYAAGRSIITGNSNTFVGYSAGYHASQLTSASNSMALGNGAYTTASNQVIIGNASVNVGLAQTIPTARFHLPAGTATAGTAPLKLTAGVNLTTPEAGAMEWDGSNLFVTQTTGPTRKTLAYTTDITPSNWDTIGDPSGNGAIAFGSTVQSMDWGTATTQNALSLTGGALTTGKLLSLSSNTLTSGTLLDITSAGTGALTNQKGLNIALSGTNGTAAQTTYGAYISNTHAGTTSTNVGLYATASGATNNYAGIFENGNVGIGTTNPQYALEISGGGSFNVNTTLNTQGWYLDGQRMLTGTAGDWIYLNKDSGFPLGVYTPTTFRTDGELQAGGSGNRFVVKSTGNVGIGQTSPTAALHLKAGTATAGTAPFKFTSGTNLTTPEAGAMEWDGSNLFVTQASGPTRKTLAFTSDITTSQWTTTGSDIYYNTGRTFIGAISEATSSSSLFIQGSTSASGSSSAITGILGGYTFNPTAGGVQVGNRFVITNSPTTTANTAVGEIIRVVDNTTLANLVRGLDLTSNAGSNTAGTNTGLRASGATFGVQGVTTGLAGGVSVPAALYGENTGTTQGDVLRLFSSTMTSANAFASFYHDTSNYSGTGLLMDFATGSGTFSGNFVDFQKNNASLFKVTHNGILSMGLSSTSATSALCSSLANGTSPTSGVAYEIRDCSSTPVADYAEMYSVDSGIEYGDIVAVGSQKINTYDVGNDGGIDWNKTKGTVNRLIKADKEYQNNVIGIVSDNYNDFSSVGYNIKTEDNPMPVALNGRVPVKVSSFSEEIKAGDYLTTSDDEGKAMKALKSGFTIGKALEDWSPDSGKEMVMVFVEQGYHFGEEVSMGGLTVFDTDAKFIESVVFDSQVEFILPPLFNSDTAGFAIIKEGTRKVEIVFDNPYIAQPVVSTTISFEDIDDIIMTDQEADDFFNQDIQTIITNKTQNGFMIRINKDAPRDIVFSWTAFSVRDPKVFESIIEGLIIEPPIDIIDTTENTTDTTDNIENTNNTEDTIDTTENTDITDIIENIDVVDTTEDTTENTDVVDTTVDITETEETIDIILDSTSTNQETPSSTSSPKEIPLATPVLITDDSTTQ